MEFSAQSFAHLGKLSVITAGTVMTHYVLKSDQAIAATALGLGIGDKAVQSMFQLAGDMMPSFMNDAVKRIPAVLSCDHNDDLEKAVIEAYRLTFKKVEDELVQTLQIGEKFYTQVINFGLGKYSDEKYLRDELQGYFKTVLTYFTDPEAIASLVAVNEQNWPVNYLGVALKRCQDILFPADDLLEKDHLLSSISIAAQDEFPKAFTRVLRDKEAARNVYFKMMLEQGFRSICLIHEDTEKINEKTTMLQEVCGEANVSLKELLANFNGQLELVQSLQEQVGKLDKLPQDMDLIKSQLLDQGLMLKELVFTPDDLGAQLADISGNLAFIRKQQLGIEAVQQDLARLRSDFEQAGCWAPQLVLFVEKPDIRINIFNYKTRFTDFIGRTEEMSHLMNFLRDDARFLWWKVQGPGGMGKSRLAMEFCFKAELLGFHAGFFNADNILPDAAKPFKTGYPILLVIDYALADEARTLKLLHFLHQTIRSQEQTGNGRSQKVRVLLLDRNYKADWFLNAADVLGSCYRTNDTDELPGPLILQEGAEDLRWAIIRQVFDKTAPDKWILIANSQNEILETLGKIDPEKRPVYAFFAGEALAVHGSIRNWDVHRLLTFHLARIETNIWGKLPHFKGFAREFKQLMLVSTLIRSMSIEEAGQVVCLWEFTPHEEHLVLDLFREIADSKMVDKPKIVRQLTRWGPNGLENIPVVMPGVFVQEREFYGLLPDVLGEYFILDFARRLNDDFGPRLLTELFTLAWTIRPQLTWWTLALMHQDFFSEEQVRPEFARLKDLLFYGSGDNQMPAVAEAKAKLMFQITHNEGTREHINPSLGNLAASHALVQAHPGNPEVAREHGKLLQNLTAYDGPNARRYVPELFELYQQSGRNAEIGSFLVQGIQNCTVFAVDANSVKAVFDACFDQAQTVFRDHPDNLQQAKYLLMLQANLVKFRDGLSYYDVQQKILPFVNEILIHFPADAEIAEYTGTIWRNCQLLATYNSQWKFLPNLAENIYLITMLNSAAAAQLAALCAEWLGNANWSTKTAPQAPVLLDVLKRLQQEHPQEVIFKQHLGIAYFSMGVINDHPGGPQVKDTYYQDLLKLYDDTLFDLDIGKSLAKYTVNLIWFSQNDGMDHIRFDLLPELKKLYRDFPGQASIAEPYAVALSVVVRHAIADDQEVIVVESEFVDRLHNLHNEFPENLEIGRSMLRQLLFLAIHLGPDHLDRLCADYLPEGIRLRQLFPDDLQIAQYLAELIVKIAGYLQETGRSASIADLYPPLEKTWKAHAASETMSDYVLQYFHILFTVHESTNPQLFDQVFLPALFEIASDSSVDYPPRKKVSECMLALRASTSPLLYADLQLKYLPALRAVDIDHNRWLATDFLQILSKQSSRDDYDAPAIAQRFFPDVQQILQEEFFEYNCAIWGVNILTNWAIDLIPADPHYIEQTYLPLMEEIRRHHQNDIDVARQCSKVYVNLGRELGKSAVVSTESKYHAALIAMHNQFPDSPELLCHLNKSLINLAVFKEESDPDYLDNVVMPQLSNAFTQFPDFEEIAEGYANGITATVVLYFKLEKPLRISKLRDELNKLLAQFPENETIALHAAQCYQIMLDYQSDESIAGFMTVSQPLLYQLYERFNGNEIIAAALYTSIYIDIYFCRATNSDIQDEVAFLERLFTEFANSDVLKNLRQNLADRPI